MSERSGRERPWLSRPAAGCASPTARWADAWLESSLLLEGTYADQLPRSARDENFAAWVTRTMSRSAPPSGAIAVDLEFAGPINLGNIATGRQKNVIDCLYPVIGGRPGFPNDARITLLEATRMVAEVAAGVRIRVTEACVVDPLEGVRARPNGDTMNPSWLWPASEMIHRRGCGLRRRGGRGAAPGGGRWVG